MSERRHRAGARPSAQRQSTERSGRAEPEPFEHWLDEQLACERRRARELGPGTERSSRPSVVDLRPSVLRRLRRLEAERKASGPDLAVPLLVLAATVLLVFAAGLWIQRATAPADAEAAAPRLSAVLPASGSSSLGAAARRRGRDGGDHDLDLLQRELDSLSQQLLELRRVRDASGPTLELTSQDGLALLVPLRVALAALEPEDVRAAMRRVRW